MRSRRTQSLERTNRYLVRVQSSSPDDFVLSEGSQIDCGFTTIPQTALNGRQLPYSNESALEGTHSRCEVKANDRTFPGGRCLGGSSTINGLIYIGGSAGVFDNMWESLGNPGWNWSSVSPYLAKVSSRMRRM